MDGYVLMGACLGWGILCGAIVYEHLAVIPVWTREPPESLNMWRGPHRLRAERFWMAIHPLLLLLLSVALYLVWADEARRALLLWVIGGYGLVIATTAAYYVPELMKLTRDPDTTTLPVEEWRARARRWHALCYPRSLLVLALSVPLFRALPGL